METVTLILLLALQLQMLAVLYVLLKKRGKRLSKRPVFVDTSALMDGRIMAAVQSGFTPAELVIPESVVAELQLLADGADNDRRARARHGLDVVAMLRESPHTHARVLRDGKPTTGVDDRLIELAEKHRGAICTIDFNLNKVAATRDIAVLNINELAQELRMAHLPGETVSLPILQKGNDARQGVGYLPDGTMVVVEQAHDDIGKTVEIEFIRSLQTAAGRMLFAKKTSVKPAKAEQPSNKRTARGRAPASASTKSQSDTPAKKPAQRRRPRSAKSSEASLVALANTPQK